MDNRTKSQKLLDLINHPATPQHERILAKNLFNKLNVKSDKQYILDALNQIENQNSLESQFKEFKYKRY